MVGFSHHKPYRDEECPKWLVKYIQEQSHEIMFTTGLPARPCPPPVPPRFEWSIGDPPTQRAVVIGMVYIDDALQSMIPCARRVGWAYVVISEGVEPNFAL